MSPEITITSEELRERVEDRLDRWIPDDVWNRAEPYARHKNEVNRQRHPEIDYKKAEAAGMTKERTNARIVEKYKKQDPATLTRQEYDEICTSLDNAAAQHNQQGGNA